MYSTFGKLIGQLDIEETETEEMFQNAGQKGTPHRDPDDPPRHHANKRRGLGTMENDQPPILGVAGRTTGQIRLTVYDNTQQVTIQPQIEKIQHRRRDPLYRQKLSLQSPRYHKPRSCHRLSFP